MLFCGLFPVLVSSSLGEFDMFSVVRYQLPIISYYVPS